MHLLKPPDQCFAIIGVMRLPMHELSWSNYLCPIMASAGVPAIAEPPATKMEPREASKLLTPTRTGKQINYWTQKQPTHSASNLPRAQAQLIGPHPLHLCTQTTVLSCCRHLEKQSWVSSVQQMTLCHKILNDHTQWFHIEVNQNWGQSGTLWYTAV